MSWRGERGSVALATIGFLPIAIVLLTAVLELGLLRVTTARVRSAADLAALVAVNDQDESELRSTGRLRLGADAEAVARDYLAANLLPLSTSLGSSAQSIADGASVVVLSVAGVDSATGLSYNHPTIRISASVPIRTPLFGALRLSPVTTVQVLATSSAR